MSAVDRLADVEAVLTALGDATRRQIYEVLLDQGSATATGLAPEFRISRQAVAKHLNILAAGGLATFDRVGRETVYRPAEEGLNDLVAWAAATRSAWHRRLDRL